MTMYINQIVLNRYDLYLKTVSTCIVACVSRHGFTQILHDPPTEHKRITWPSPYLSIWKLHDPPYMYVSPGPLPCEYNERSPGSHLLRRPAAPDLGPPWILYNTDTWDKPGKMRVESNFAQ